MAEPTTPNLGLIVPNTGDLVGTWGSAALNVDLVGLDGMLGGLTTISLSGTSTVTLTTNGATFAPTSGPNQSQNALISLTGAISGTNTIVLTMPGIYRFFNGINDFTHVVLVTSVGAGLHVGLPPGEFHTLFHDGTNVLFTDLERVGAQVNISGLTALAPWMTACSVSPYLVRDGTVYNNTQFPALGALLGSKFGGNGTSTFGVPDSRARADVGYDPSGSTGRLTGFAGPSGGTMGSHGGEEGTFLGQDQLPNVDFSPNSGTVFTNESNLITGNTQNITVQGASNLFTVFSANQVTRISASVNLPNYNSGGSGNELPTVQPTIVSFLPLIKT